MSHYSFIQDPPMAPEFTPIETKVKWSQGPEGSRRPLLPPTYLTPSSRVCAPPLYVWFEKAL